MTATVHHLPTASPTLDEQVAALAPGQWVRVTLRNSDPAHREYAGTIEGPTYQPTNVRNSLFIGHYCLRVNGYTNADVTGIATEPPADLDMDVLAALVEEHAHTLTALDEAPVGRFGTGSNDAEQNAVYEAERAVRAYLRSVKP